MEETAATMAGRVESVYMCVGAGGGRGGKGRRAQTQTADMMVSEGWWCGGGGG